MLRGLSDAVSAADDDDDPSVPLLNQSNLFTVPFEGGLLLVNKVNDDAAAVVDDVADVNDDVDVVDDLTVPKNSDKALSTSTTAAAAAEIGFAKAGIVCLLHCTPLPSAFLGLLAKKDSNSASISPNSLPPVVVALLTRPRSHLDNCAIVPGCPKRSSHSRTTP